MLAQILFHNGHQFSLTQTGAFFSWVEDGVMGSRPIGWSYIYIYKRKKVGLSKM